MSTSKDGAVEKKIENWIKSLESRKFWQNYSHNQNALKFEVADSIFGDLIYLLVRDLNDLFIYKYMKHLQ